MNSLLVFLSVDMFHTHTDSSIHIHPRTWFLGFCFSFLCGIMIWWHISALYLWGLCLLILGNIIVLRLYPISYLCSLVLCWTLWVWYSHTIRTEIQQKGQYIAEYTEWYHKKVSIQGKIMDSGVQQASSLRYRLTFDNFDISSPNEKYSLFLIVPDNIHISKWSIVEVVSKIFPPKNLSILEDSFLLSNEVLGYIYAPYVEVRQTPVEDGMYSSFLSMRVSLWKIIDTLFPMPVSWLISGLTIGNIDNFDSTLIESFKRSGIMHIVAVSGSNITLIILFLEWLLTGYSRKIRLTITLSILFLFVHIVWYEIPILRAVAMGGIAYMSLLSGKRMKSFVLFIGITVLFILCEPTLIMGNMSFLLSFGATLGIITLWKSLQKHLSFLPNIFLIRESLAVTLSAIIGIFPLMMDAFGYFPFITIITNIAIAPILWATTLLAWISFLSEWVSSYLAYILGYIPFMFAKWILYVAKLGSEYPLMVSFSKDILGGYFSLYYYSILFYIMIHSHQTQTIPSNSPHEP